MRRMWFDIRLLTCQLYFYNTCEIEDFTITKRLRDMVKDGANQDDFKRTSMETNLHSQIPGVMNYEW